MSRFVNKQGDVDFVALTQEVTGGDYSPGVASLVQAQVDAGMARVDQAAARELQSAESLRTELMKVAGDLDTVAQGSGRAEMYRIEQPGWFARAVELGMPEARAYELFPPDFNLQTVVSTADILRGQAAMAAKQEMAIGAGVSFLKGDLESIDDQRKLVMYSLDVDPDMNQEKLDAYWSDAAGDDRPSLDDRMWDLSTMGSLGAAEKWEGFNKRTISPEVLASFDDLRTFDEGWRERFEAHGDRIFTEADRTWNQEVMAAFNNGDPARLKELYDLQRNIKDSESAAGSDEPELAAVRIRPVDTKPLVEEFDALVNPRGPGGRGGSYGQGPLEGEALANALDVAENAFRTKNGLMPISVEARLLVDIENLIRSEGDGGIGEFNETTWPGKDLWDAQVESDVASAGERKVDWDHREADKRREANVGAPRRIPIPENILRKWAMEFFLDEEEAGNTFRAASEYDVRRTFHAFQPGWDREWRVDQAEEAEVDES
jgi:hypothetical protein